MLAAFCPVGIDFLSFANYAATPPNVVIDHLACAKHVSDTRNGVSQARAIKWLQLSKSDRKTAQNAYQNALVRWL